MSQVLFLAVVPLTHLFGLALSVLTTIVFFFKSRTLYYYQVTPSAPPLSFINESEWVYLKSGILVSLLGRKQDKTTKIEIIPMKSRWLDSLLLILSYRILALEQLVVSRVDTLGSI